MGTAAESDVGSVMCDLITIMPGFCQQRLFADYYAVIQRLRVKRVLSTPNVSLSSEELKPSSA